jgi:hypothetical protein
MKNILLIIGATALLSSCGGLSWDDYKKTCITTESIFKSEEAAIKQCDCEIEKYKTASLKPGDMANIEKTNSVDVEGCRVNE